MQLTKERRPNRVDVQVPELGTLSLNAPKIEDFQFVKFRIEGQVAHLRLDRPSQNLLNERMLMDAGRAFLLTTPTPSLFS